MSSWHQRRCCPHERRNCHLAVTASTVTRWRASALGSLSWTGCRSVRSSTASATVNSNVPTSSGTYVRHRSDSEPTPQPGIVPTTTSSPKTESKSMFARQCSSTPLTFQRKSFAPLSLKSEIVMSFILKAYVKVY